MSRFFVSAFCNEISVFLLEKTQIKIYGMNFAQLGFVLSMCNFDFCFFQKITFIIPHSLQILLNHFQRRKWLSNLLKGIKLKMQSPVLDPNVIPVEKKMGRKERRIVKEQRGLLERCFGVRLILGLQW